MAAVTNHHKCLQTTEIYSLTTLEARSPKSVSLAEMKVSAGLVLSGGSKGGSVPCLFQCLVAAGIPWLMATSPQCLRPVYSNLSLCHLHLHIPLSVSVNSLCLPLISILVMAIRAQLYYPGESPHFKILN